MGKLISYLSIIVLIDLIFLITGQLTQSSPTSVIINAVLDPANIEISQLFILLITGGISLLAVGAAVVVGVISRSFEIILFIPVAISLSVLIGDFATVFVYLASINVVWATVIMAPIMVLFVMTIVEWLRGKD
ncbi:hypothetical protein LCGC14_1044780 [marine sediment metagenome]|uniref:Uncharacterized protein n=1 Tax=marine sediment metagenome TaxID=412755 RepID=A0A0F9QWU5_9ZZZZ